MCFCIPLMNYLFIEQHGLILYFGRRFSIFFNKSSMFIMNVLFIPKCLNELIPFSLHLFRVRVSLNMLIDLG